MLILISISRTANLKTKTQNMNKEKTLDFGLQLMEESPGFGGDSGGAFLGCYSCGPDFSDGGLGVFPCAEGASQKSGGLK